MSKLQVDRAAVAALETGPGRTDAAVYKQIAADIRFRIGQGQWAVGEMLPGRRDLARHYSVSPLTVERAVSGLISEGLLRADGRRGTFIARSVSDTANVRGSGVSDAKPSCATIGIVGRLFVGWEGHLDLNNQCIRLLAHSIESACAHDKNVTRFTNQVDPDTGRVMTLPEAVAQACDTDVDALALLGMGIDSNELECALDVHARLGKGRPIVVLSTSGQLGRPVAQVYYDNWGAGYEAAAHLATAGCRRVLMFAPVSAEWGAERVAGARAAVANLGLPDEWLSVGPSAVEPWQQMVDPVALAERSAREIIAAEVGRVWDGVLCIQDQGGYGFMKAAAENGLSAGVDYAIIGFDDAEHSRSVNLSSMRPPFEKMGIEAVKLLRTAMTGEPVVHQVCLRWQLIARTSTASRNISAAH